MEALTMSTIRFIIEGAQAADQASELKQHLQTEWEAQVEIKSSSSNAQDAIHKGIELDLIRVAVEVYGAFKIVSNAQNEITETKQQLQKLASWVEKILTLNGKVIWMEVSGISYPLVADKIDDIIEAMQKQEEE